MTPAHPKPLAKAYVSAFSDIFSRYSIKPTRRFGCVGAVGVLSRWALLWIISRFFGFSLMVCWSASSLLTAFPALLRISETSECTLTLLLRSCLFQEGYEVGMVALLGHLKRCGAIAGRQVRIGSVS